MDRVEGWRVDPSPAAKSWNKNASRKNNKK